MKTVKKRKYRLRRVEKRLAAVERRVESLEHSEGQLYWAYGSNLNVAAMKGRCPRATKVGKLILPNGQLVFRGVCDVEIVDDADCFIPGGLWRISKACERALDQYEGFPRFYIKRYMLLRFKGREERCMFYMMDPDNPHHSGQVPPYGGYYETVAKGYDDFGLDKTYLEDALRRSHDTKEWTESTRERWLRKGKPKLTQIEIEWNKEAGE
jgi:hypothetical protein